MRVPARLGAVVALMLACSAACSDGGSPTAATTTSLPPVASTLPPTKPVVIVPAVATPSQLRIDDLAYGNGDTVVAGDAVSVRYVGVNFRTRKEFDSSYERGQPFTFIVGKGQVIAGWDQGLVGMRPGGRRQLLIPAALGYGSTGSGPDIAPGDALVFVVDLVSIRHIGATGFAYGTGACPPSERPASVPTPFVDAPRQCIADGASPKAVVDTSEGSFTIQLDGANAPGTVNNFVVLSRWGWFDDNLFHRVVRDYVIQAGGKPPHDDPGYAIPDELPSSLDAYPRYAVAMANTGSPGTGGGQWFVCLGCSSLPGPQYTVFGQVVAGTAVIDAINGLGMAGADGAPSKAVSLKHIDIVDAG